MNTLRIVFLLVMVVLFAKDLKSDPDVWTRIRAAVALLIMVELAFRAFDVLLLGRMGFGRRLLIWCIALILISSWGIWLSFGYSGMREVSEKLGLPFEDSFVWWRSRYDWWLCGSVVFAAIYGIGKLGRKQLEATGSSKRGETTARLVGDE